MKVVLYIVLGLLGLGAAGVAIAAWRWRARTAGIIDHLGDGASPSPSAHSSDDLQGLPPPAAAYFRTVLREGQPMIRGGRITQEGEFLVQPEKGTWGAFRAVHRFSAEPPGFVWDATIRMAPGLSVWVRDAFAGGRGSMQASLLGAVSLAAVEGTPEIAAGALHRYLAEAVWYPTALLPSQGVTWAPLNESSARATLSAGGTTVSLDFHFRGDGLVDGVYAPARFRDVEGRAVPTPWRGRFSGYAERGGLLIPLEGEVGWVLPEGLQTYWRGRLTGVSYDLSGTRRK